MVNNGVFINGVGIISPQKTAGNNEFPSEIISAETTFLKCQEPNYRDFISGDSVRRMSRLIKMGVTASRMSLSDAACLPDRQGYQMPDAIITGTGLGCIEDTEKFLTTMITNNEELLTPTSFIQSTHNTVSAQIALLLKCHNYNFTYVHRGFSFESAILDSMIQIETGRAATVLLGGMDELTSNTHKILQRLAHVKSKPVNNLDLYKNTSRGTIAGEGSSFFVLSPNPGIKNYGRIKAIGTFFKPADQDETLKRITGFLEQHNPGSVLPDLILLGKNGDPGYDKYYHLLAEQLFGKVPKGYYKHLCGEYFTSTSFALWLAAIIMNSQAVPGIVLQEGPAPAKIRDILIYNQFRNIDHSLILVSQS